MYTPCVYWCSPYPLHHEHFKLRVLKHIDPLYMYLYLLQNVLSIDISYRSESRHQVSFSGQVGTPLYMSPEQLEHTRCTEKVDIYALGVIYFEMNNIFGTGEKATVRSVGVF